MNGVNQIVYGYHTVFFCDSGEMCITGSCFRAGMAEEGLDVAEA